MVRRPVRGSRMVCAGALAAAMMCAGCSLARSEPDAAGARGAGDVTGVWEGLAVDDCSFRIIDQNRCAATVRIMLTLIQRDSAVSGFYKCATDTFACPIEQEGGTIACGEVHARRLAFRLMLPDGTGCLYRAARAGEEMHGRYLCLGGGVILERGWFEVQRSY